MAYALPADLLAYMGDEVDLPSESEQARLLERASELIDAVTLNRIDDDDTDHTDAAQTAAVAQVAYWLEGGEAVDITGTLEGYSIGSLRVSYGSGAARTAPGRLAPRAKQALMLAGLMYRGVGVR